jgi:hypothetical protein
VSFKVEKCTVFNEFKLEKCTPDFWVFMNNFKKPPSALWECGKAEGFSKALWEVWESRKTFPCFPQ